VGCSGASGARNRGCGAPEVADDGLQDCSGAVATVIERRRTRGSEMRPCDEVKEVEGNSWTLCGTKKGHEQAGAAASDRRRNMAAAGDGSMTWRGGEKPAGSGERASGRAGGPGGGVRAARGSWQRVESLARGGERWSRAAERKGRDRKTTGTCSQFFKSSKGSL
jgi:hypothetical protein